MPRLPPSPLRPGTNHRNRPPQRPLQRHLLARKAPNPRHRRPRRPHFRRRKKIRPRKVRPRNPPYYFRSRHLDFPGAALVAPCFAAKRAGLDSKSPNIAPSTNAAGPRTFGVRRLAAAFTAPPNSSGSAATSRSQHPPALGRHPEERLSRRRTPSPPSPARPSAFLQIH